MCDLSRSARSTKARTCHEAYVEKRTPRDASNRAQQPLGALLQKVGALHDRRARPVGPDLVHLIVNDLPVVQEQLVVRGAPERLLQPKLDVAHRGGHLARDLCSALLPLILGRGREHHRLGRRHAHLRQHLLVAEVESLVRVARAIARSLGERSVRIGARDEEDGARDELELLLTAERQRLLQDLPIR
jgi:hypothetical protein